MATANDKTTFLNALRYVLSADISLLTASGMRWTTQKGPGE